MLLWMSIPDFTKLEHLFVLLILSHELLFQHLCMTIISNNNKKTSTKGDTTADFLFPLINLLTSLMPIILIDFDPHFHPS